MNDLHIERYGDGPIKVVGYHGWGADHLKSFANVIDTAPEEVSFFGVDLPGYGQSPLPDVFTYPEVTRMLVRGLDRILDDDERARLVGACSGSYHVLEVARQRPEKVELAVLVEPLAFYPWFLRALLLPVVGRILYDGIFDSALGRLVTQTTMNHQDVAGDYDVMESFGSIDLDIPYRYLDFYDHLGEVSQYAEFPVPTRVVYGENTWKAVIESADIWEATFPQVEVRRIRGVGHLVNQEAPDAVVEALSTPHPVQPTTR